MKNKGFSGIIGVAREDITPPVGIFCRNWGAAKHDAATGIHRPLCLTALTLRECPKSLPLVLIDADLGWFANVDYGRRFIQRIRSGLSLPPERVIFAFTHTHSAPPLTDPEPDWEGGELLPAYSGSVLEAVFRAVSAALASAEPALLEWHAGRCSLASNRDLPHGGRITVGCNPEAAADDTLLVGRVSRMDGSCMATLANYACHPTTLAWENSLISPDFIGAMRETVEERTGGAPALFMQGASGELAPRHQYSGDASVADRHGRQLGHAVLATLEDMELPGHELELEGVVESGAPLAVWKAQRRTLPSRLLAEIRRVELPLKQWPSAAALEEQLRACEDRAMAERLRRKLLIRKAIGVGDTFPLELTGWRLGDAVLFGTMAEAYSGIQRHLRDRNPENPVLWMNLVNGSIGYLPPAPLYRENIYSAWQTPFDTGSLELLTEESARLAGELLHCQEKIASPHH